MPLTLEKMITFGGYVMALVVGILLYFFPARRKQLDDATAKLITTLQETVKALEQDLNLYKAKTLQLESQQHENMARIASIEAEKQLLRDFLNGRDKATTEFQTTTLNLHKENSKKIGDLLEVLSKHFLTMENVALNK